MKTNNIFSVYKHTSPSGKCYIGITHFKVEKRWGRNGYNYLKQKRDKKFKHPYFANAILKYGWDNFRHEIILENISESEAKYTEKYLIKWYKLYNLSYNVTDGGDGSSGYRFSKETITKLSESHKGIKQSAETILKRVKKNKGKKRTDQQKSKTSKKVIQYDLSGNFIAEFFGIREASRQTGVNVSSIVECCNKKKNRKSAGGFIWRFFGDSAKPLIKDNHNKKKVMRYDSFGNAKTWDSMIDAIRECNLTRYKLQTYCNKNMKDDHGNSWKFIS